MDRQSCEATGATGARITRRVAFAAALAAVPLLSVLVNPPLYEEIVEHTGRPATEASHRRPAHASVLADRTASAAPDHALLDASDVRRALPAPPQEVAGLQTRTL